MKKELCIGLLILCVVIGSYVCLCQKEFKLKELVENNRRYILVICVCIGMVTMFIMYKNKIGQQTKTVKKDTVKKDTVKEIQSNFDLDESGKLKIDEKCKFSGYGFDDNWEIGECSIAYQVIPYCKNVLEIGGGTGKVSHIINKILKQKSNQYKHLVLEPNDENTMGGNDNIYKNKQKFNDNYTVLEKYAQNLTMEDLDVLGDPPDCLYADCEGCLYEFMNTEIGKYVLNNVRFIVNEMDGYNDDLRKIWKDNGFKKIGVGYGCGINCETDVWYRN